MRWGQVWEKFKGSFASQILKGPGVTNKGDPEKCTSTIFGARKTREFSKWKHSFYVTLVGGRFSLLQNYYFVSLFVSEAVLIAHRYDYSHGAGVQKRVLFWLSSSIWSGYLVSFYVSSTPTIWSDFIHRHSLHTK